MINKQKKVLLEETATLKLQTSKYLKIRMRHKKLTLKIMLGENPQTTFDRRPKNQSSGFQQGYQRLVKICLLRAMAIQCDQEE